MHIAIPIEFILYPLLSLVVYWRSLGGPLIFDDFAIEPAIRTLHKRFWETYRPASIVTHCLVRKWPGTFRAERCFNVWVHAACALIVSRLAGYAGLDHSLSVLAGLIYVVHPFAVNTVGYVTARSSLMVTFWGLLGAWAILAGVPVLALPCLVAAMFSKEDAAVFILLYIALGSFWFVIPGLILLGVALRPRPIYKDKERSGISGYRSLFAEYLQHNGDQVMKAIGLPTSHPPAGHFITVLVETFWKLPQWFLGLGRSPYHGSGIPFPKWWKMLSAFAIASALGFLGEYAPLPLMLLMLGPWLLYLFMPVPDQLMEYRNYAMISGVAIGAALVLSMLPAWCWWLAVCAWACYSAYDVVIWSDAVLLWTRASRSSSGESSRAYQEIGAVWKIRGQDAKAEPFLMEALRRNPTFAPAATNLAWIWLVKGQHQEALTLMDNVLQACPNYDLGITDYASMQNYVGVSAYMTKSFGMAKQWFVSALGRRPDYAPFRYNVAVTKRVLGENADLDFAQLPQQMPYSRDMIRPDLAGLTLQ